jgi:hypothetical protein
VGAAAVCGQPCVLRGTRSSRRPEAASAPRTKHRLKAKRPTSAPRAPARPRAACPAPCASAGRGGAGRVRDEGRCRRGRRRGGCARRSGCGAHARCGQARRRAVPRGSAYCRRLRHRAHGGWHAVRRGVRLGAALVRRRTRCAPLSFQTPAPATGVPLRAPARAPARGRAARRTPALSARACAPPRPGRAAGALTSERRCWDDPPRARSFTLIFGSLVDTLGSGTSMSESLKPVILWFCYLGAAASVAGCAARRRAAPGAGAPRAAGRLTRPGAAARAQTWRSPAGRWRACGRRTASGARARAQRTLPNASHASHSLRSLPRAAR